MPKNNNRKRSGRRNRRRNVNSNYQSGGLVTRVSFSEIWSQTWTAQSDMRTFGLTSANSGITRLNDLGQYFQFYRFTKVRFTLYPSANASLAMCYSGAIAGVSDITTFAEAAETQPSILVTGSITVPKVMKIGRRVLLETPSKWFPYNSGATAYQPTQGNLHLVPSSSITATILVKIDGELEFIRPSAGSGLDKDGGRLIVPSHETRHSSSVTREELSCSCCACAGSESTNKIQTHKPV